MANKQFTVKFLVIPDFVFLNENLNFMAAKIYAFIHNYKMEEFFYGNERLMELFKCSESTVSRAISQLEKEGYITTSTNGRKRFIKDNYITQRVVKIDYPESAEVTMQDEAEESAELTTRNEANQAELIGKNNNKSQEKNGDYPMRKKREEKKKVIGGWGSGKPQESRPLKEYPEKGGYVNAKDII